jgi:hypothetical protein
VNGLRRRSLLAATCGIGIAGATRLLAQTGTPTGPKVDSIAFALPGTAGTRWIEQRLRGVAPNRFSLEQDAGRAALRVASAAAASSLVHRFQPARADARTLRWRWRADALPAGARFGDREADDFAMRLYVMFDYPLARVPWGQRTVIELGRAIYGDVPAATICYVHDADRAVGTLADSPFTRRVRMFVASSGPPDAWMRIERNLFDDFQRAFGAEHGPGIAPVESLAVAVDTDQTGAHVTGWFADLQLR